MGQDYLLSIKNLSIHFNSYQENTKIVDTINLQIKKGEIVGLIGESGSGKSITALSILQLVSKQAKISGEIIYQTKEGKYVNLLNLTTQQIIEIRGREISMIFQEPMTALNPVMRCGYQITEVIKSYYNVSQKEAIPLTLDWLEKVQLTDAERIFYSFPHQLSGGQRQRVMIAMAMASDPRLLIADEPTTALDVTTQKSIIETLKALQKNQHLSILFISHNLPLVAQIANSIFIIKEGKIIESGSQQSIFEYPKQHYTKALMMAQPPIHKKIHRLPTISVENIKNEVPNKSQNNNNILEVKKLNTWFLKNKQSIFEKKSYVKAIQNVSFDLKEGNTLGVVGESGSGKTTLGRSILRLVEPCSGEVYFKNEDILKLSFADIKSIRKEIQIIFQDPYASLNPRIPIGTAISEPMRQYKIDSSKDKVIELLEIVGLKADYFYRLPYEFSGGQRQRICLARALATNPKLLICDECVSSLDVSTQAQILNLLKDLQEKLSLSYLFISHDLSVIRFMSDDIMVMQEGKVVECANTEELFNRPKDSYTQQLLSSMSI